MRRLTLALFALSAFAAPAAAQAPPQGCGAPEYRQLDFWVGEWDVYDALGKPTGTHRIEVVEGGCGLLAHWDGAAGGTGTSLSFYDAADRKWHQAWIGSTGKALTLTGGPSDGGMIFEGDTAGGEGRRMRTRITWTRAERGELRQKVEMSTTGGQTWQLVSEAIYSRRAPREE